MKATLIKAKEALELALNFMQDEGDWAAYKEVAEALTSVKRSLAILNGEITHADY